MLLMESENPTLAPVEAELVYTERHLMDSLNRMRSQSSGRRLWTWLRYVPASIFGAVAIGALIAQHFLTAIVMISLVVLCFLSKGIDDYLAKRTFKKSAFRDVKYTLKISHEGFDAESEIDQSTVKWSVFSNAVFFNDGILLQHVSKMVTWIPDCSFTIESGPSIAREIVAGQLSVRDAVS